VLVPAAPVKAVTPYCKQIDATVRIKEGSVRITTARVYITGRYCITRAGWLDRGRTDVEMSIATSKPGSVSGFTYWARNSTQVVTDTKRTNRFRLPVAYHVCALKYVPACGLEAQFQVDVVVRIFLPGTATWHYTKPIKNTNVWGAAQWR